MSRPDLTEKEARAELKRAMPWAKSIAINSWAGPAWNACVWSPSVVVSGNGRTLRAAVSAAKRAWQRAKGR
jgi:hypothetical protein